VKIKFFKIPLSRRQVIEDGAEDGRSFKVSIINSTLKF